MSEPPIPQLPAVTSERAEMLLSPTHDHNAALKVEAHSQGASQCKAVEVEASEAHFDNSIPSKRDAERDQVTHIESSHSNGTGEAPTSSENESENFEVVEKVEEVVPPQSASTDPSEAECVLHVQDKPENECEATTGSETNCNEVQSNGEEMMCAEIDATIENSVAAVVAMSMDAEEHAKNESITKAAMLAEIEDAIIAEALIDPTVLSETVLAESDCESDTDTASSSETESEAAFENLPPGMDRGDVYEGDLSNLTEDEVNVLLQQLQFKAQTQVGASRSQPLRRVDSDEDKLGFAGSVDWIDNKLKRRLEAKKRVEELDRELAQRGKPYRGMMFESGEGRRRPKSAGFERQQDRCRSATAGRSSASNNYEVKKETTEELVGRQEIERKLAEAINDHNVNAVEDEVDSSCVKNEECKIETSSSLPELEEDAKQGSEVVAPAGTEPQKSSPIASRASEENSVIAAGKSASKVETDDADEESVTQGIVKQEDSASSGMVDNCNEGQVVACSVVCRDDAVSECGNALNKLKRENDGEDGLGANATQVTGCMSDFVIVEKEDAEGMLNSYNSPRPNIECGLEGKSRSVGKESNSASDSDQAQLATVTMAEVDSILNGSKAFMCTLASTKKYLASIENRMNDSSDHCIDVPAGNTKDLRSGSSVAHPPQVLVNESAETGDIPGRSPSSGNSTSVPTVDLVVTAAKDIFTQVGSIKHIVSSCMNVNQHPSVEPEIVRLRNQNQLLKQDYRNLEREFEKQHTLIQRMLSSREAAGKCLEEMAKQRDNAVQFAKDMATRNPTRDNEKDPEQELNEAKVRILEMESEVHHLKMKNAKLEAVEVEKQPDTVTTTTAMTEVTTAPAATEAVEKTAATEATTTTATTEVTTTTAAIEVTTTTTATEVTTITAATEVTTTTAATKETSTMGWWKRLTTRWAKFRNRKISPMNCCSKPDTCSFTELPSNGSEQGPSTSQSKGPSTCPESLFSATPTARESTSEDSLVEMLNDECSNVAQPTSSTVDLECSRKSSLELVVESEAVKRKGMLGRFMAFARRGRATADKLKRLKSARIAPSPH